MTSNSAEINSQYTHMQLIDASHPQLHEIITPCIGNPTNTKIQKIIQNYKTLNHHLIGCLLNNNLIGVIGFQFIDSKAIIKHISVHSEYRHKKIGKDLIHYAIKYFTITLITAETDDESVGFYKKLGFQCNTFENSYGIRYHCKLEISA